MVAAGSRAGTTDRIAVGPGWVPSFSSRIAPWIVAASSSLSCLAFGSVVGCGASDGSDEPVIAKMAPGTSEPMIFGGTQDDDAQAIPGVVALRVGAGGTFELCSATLIASNVVLTARHCVTKNSTTSVSCDEDGHSANGPHIIGDQDPINVAVYVGATPHFADAPVAHAKALLAPRGQYLCDSDIALVILDAPITDVAPLPVRLGTPAQAGETIRSVGYGQNDDHMPIGTRFRKDGVPVLAQGKAISASKTPLGPHEFEVGKSICQGDSGGPAISEATGAVIGVVSRGGGCTDDFGHIYTTTAGFDELFAEAFALADAQPTLENASATKPAAESNAPAAAPKDSSSSDSGCSAAPAPMKSHGGGTGLAVILAATLVARARSRSRSKSR